MANTTHTQTPHTASYHRTPLYDLHQELGAKMAPFAGYEMPINYPMGVMQEHLHTRKQAGLFDVSHMGQLLLRAKSGNIEEAALGLERLIPTDILGLGVDRQRYGLLTNDSGGIVDDLMISRKTDHFLLVVNAATKDADQAHLIAHLGEQCDIIALKDRALIALQGPKSAEVLRPLIPQIAHMRFMDSQTHIITLPQGDKIEAWISRSGYTGEDGFEISVPDHSVTALSRQLLANPDVAPIGLGARDSLRLEAGLCLYGSDITPHTTPIAANLLWAIPKVRRAAGARAGGFFGADIVLNDIDKGPKQQRVGLRPEGRAPMRGGTDLYASPDAQTPIGHITSGGFGVSIGGPIAMGYVDSAYTRPGTSLWGDVRGKRLAVSVVTLPFQPPGYKR